MNQNNNFYEENNLTITKEVNRIYPIFKTVLDANGEREVVEYAIGYINAIIDGSGFKDNITCTTSECSWCCHEKILMSPIEHSYIAQRVNEHKIKPDKRRSKLQNSSPDFNKLKFADKACPFLSSADGKGKCTIYEIRPFICRVHNSTEFSLKCNKELYPNQSIQEAKIIEIEAVAVVLMLLSQDINRTNKIELIPIHKIF